MDVLRGALSKGRAAGGGSPQKGGPSTLISRRAFWDGLHLRSAEAPAPPALTAPSAKFEKTSSLWEGPGFLDLHRHSDSHPTNTTRLLSQLPSSVATPAQRWRLPLAARVVFRKGPSIPSSLSTHVQEIPRPGNLTRGAAHTGPFLSQSLLFGPQAPNV